MDNYTRIVLTVIAACLLAITIKFYEPQKAIAENKTELSDFKSQQIVRIGPTVGDMAGFLDCKTQKCRQEMLEALKKIPVVKLAEDYPMLK